MYRKLLIGLFGILVSASAQTPTYQWHTFFNPGESGWNGPRGSAVTTDAEGNIYVAGTTFAYLTNSFAPGEPLHPVPLDTQTRRVAFVMKLNPSGQVIWHTFYTGYQGASAHAVAVDSGGGVYVTGNGELWVDGSQPPRNPATGPQSLYILKLDEDGLFQWHTHYSDGAEGTALAVDSARGYVYVTGMVHSHAGWIAPAPPIRPHQVGINDIVVIALNNRGEHQWYTFHGVGGPGGGFAIAVDGAGSIYAGGEQTNGFTILKLSGPEPASDWGSLAWMRGAGLGQVRAIAVDTAANVYAAGWAYPFNGPSGEPPHQRLSGWIRRVGRHREV